MPAAQSTITAFNFWNSDMTPLVTCSDRVSICNRPCSSIFVKKVIGLSTCLSRNAKAKGKAKAKKLWIEISDNGPALVTQWIQAPHVNWARARSAKPLLRSYIVLLSWFSSCLSSFATADMSLSTVCPSISCESPRPESSPLKPSFWPIFSGFGLGFCFEESEKNLTELQEIEGTMSCGIDLNPLCNGHLGTQKRPWPVM